MHGGSRAISRFVTGIPLALLRGLIVVWGIITLGRKNTFGLKGGHALLSFVYVLAPIAEES